MVTATNKKIVFDDDGELEGPQESKSEIIENPKLQDEEDDSDEAPEEELINKSKQQILANENHLETLEKARQQAEKDKRRRQDLYNQQQQQNKRKLQKPQVHEQDVPDILPDDIIQARNNAITPISKPQHKQLDDPELSRQLKLAKLAHLRSETSIKKGPVHVVVSKSVRGVPKAEKITSSRDKWLNRKSLKRS